MDPINGPADVPASLTVEICRDFEKFLALESDWDRLHRRCGAATPFQTHAWLRSWWRGYGKEGRLRILLVLDGGELLGAVPLMLTYRPWPVLVGWGGAISDFNDVLVADEYAAEVLPVLTKALHRRSPGRVIDLREVRPDGVAQRVFDRWPGARHRTDDSVCLELPAKDMDGLVSRLASSRAQRARSKLRKWEAAGVQVHPVTEAAEIPQAVTTLIELHLRQWEGRGVTPEHLTHRFAEHLGNAVQGMVATDNASLTLYSLDGRTVAANVTLQSGELSGGYLYGAEPELRERKLDVATLLLREEASGAAAGGRTVISLLRGNEPYKQHWKPEEIVNQRLVLAGSGAALPWRLHAALIRLRKELAARGRRHAPLVTLWRKRLGALRVGRPR
ncbi:GNAT family N-acetyltransferase [Streptomyces sp. NPDC050418]|uniref:GNAT family N-acetyltransferase n=1 Tax=Streptomyces sp. NPDC050418 TaxID=3365612 RepID=UPI0037B78AEB